VSAVNAYTVGPLVGKTPVAMPDVETVAAVAVRKARRKARRQKIRLTGVVSSIFTCAGVYLVLFYLFRSATSLSASYFGMEPLLRLDRVVFLRGDLWYPHAVLRTYLVGTVMMFCIGLMSAGLLVVVRRSMVGTRHALVWILVISSAMVCQRLVGVAVAEPFPFKELGALGFELNVYGTFARHAPSDRVLMVFIGVVLSLITAIAVTRPFLTTALSQSDVSSADRRKAFVLDRFVIPIVIGTGLVSMVAHPASIVPHMLCLLCMAFMAAVMTIMAGRPSAVRIARVSIASKWPLWPLAAFAVVALSLRALLSDGLPF
jgi:hypothetical protein